MAGKASNGKKKNGGTTAKPAFPVYYAGQQIPPDQQYYYLVGKEGIYLHKTNRFYRATIKVDGIAGLGKVKEQLALVPSFKMIPWKIIKQALTFFRAVYAKHKAEGIVLLGFDKKKLEWYLIPVEQEVQGAHVDYKVKGANGAVGTIHSHPTFSAFYSGTDDHDDNQFDGIHIVLGSITDEMPKIEVSAMVNGTRFTFEPEQVISDIPKPIEKDESHEWMDKYVKTKTYKSNNTYYPRRGYEPKSNKTQKKDSKSNSQLKLLSDDEVDKIIKRNQEQKGGESDPFVNHGTGGTEQDSTNYMKECYFALLKKEIDKLSVSHLEELFFYVEQRIEDLEDGFDVQEIEEVIIEEDDDDEDSIVMDKIYCPICGRKTDYGAEKMRWCSTCQEQYKPEDCVMPNLKKEMERIRELAGDKKKIIHVYKNEDEIPFPKKNLVQPYRDDERIYCGRCHHVTMPFLQHSKNEEDRNWHWCPICSNAIHVDNMLSPRELRVLQGIEHKIDDSIRVSDR